MNCQSVIFLFILAVFANLYTPAESRPKKVVIHIPYNIKRIKHTHIVHETVHHHHTHREPVHIAAPTEEHEHFHHVHLHPEDPGLAHPAQKHFLGVRLNMADITSGRVRPQLPLYRRNSVEVLGKT